MSDIETRASIAPRVRGIHAHPRFGLPVATKAGAGNKPGVFECPIAPVAIKEIHDAIVGDENVRPAVAVEVAQNQPQGFSLRAFEPSLGRDLAEPAAALIVVQTDSASAVDVRMAIGAKASRGIAA